MPTLLVFYLFKPLVNELQREPSCAINFAEASKISKATNDRFK